MAAGWRSAIMGYRRSRSGPPAWLVFLVAVALVFGGYYLIRGAQDFLRTGGLGVQEATERAQIIASATADREARNPTQSGAIVLIPTGTPPPACIDFRVVVSSARVRASPDGAVLTGFPQGTLVCVIRRAENNDAWYLIDQNPRTRRIDEAYISEAVIEAVNPTPTPSHTPTPLPTVTPMPISATPTITPTFTPSATDIPDFRPTLPPAPGAATDTPAPTPTPADSPSDDALSSGSGG